MNKELQFDRDLFRNRVNKLPFIELFQKNEELRNELFKQYLITNPKPDFLLYLNKYYTDKEIEKGIIEANDRIPKKNFGIADFIPHTDFEVEFLRIKREFYSLFAKKKIPKEFYKHSISKTSLMKELEGIETTIKDFNLYVTINKAYNPKEYAESWAKNLIYKLESINIGLLTKLILIDFIKKEKFNESIIDFLIDQKIDADVAKNKYRELYIYAINIFNDYLKTLPTKKGQRIKALFQFIDYLHSNIENFNSFNYLIDELDILYEKRNKLNPNKNFFDKQEVEKLQLIIDEKNKLLLTNTSNKIIQKAIRLNIYDNKNYASIYNLNKDEAYNFINVADKTEIPEVLDKKSKYIEFRTSTRFSILKLKDLYDKLDLILKVVFGYFDSETEKEFAKLPKYEKMIVKTHYQKPSRQLVKTIQEKFYAFNFFLIEVIADVEFEGKTYKDVKQRNDDSILTPENWEQHKETFFFQRMALPNYKHYTLEEKINFELEALEKLTIINNDCRVLKVRYKKYLEQKQTLPTQPIVESPFSVLEWATIFYYADETKLLPESRFIKTRIEQFIIKYEIDTTYKYFRTQYYEAKKRINKKNDYPINKLELIIPFLKENYKQTVTKIENDIIFLEDNNTDY